MSNNYIKQMSAAPIMSFFKKGLLDRWSFNEYHDSKAPCLFFGAMGQIEKINNHEGFAFVHLINPDDAFYVKFLHLNRDNLFFFDDPYLGSNLKVKKKNALIQFKDFSIFKPNTLGDKIYCYNPSLNDRIKLAEVQKNVNFEILTAGSDKSNIKDIFYIKEHYYDKSFININLEGRGGMTTLREMAYMGRKTIGNSLYKFPSFISYKDINHIVEIINQESKKIGTIQPAIISHNVNDEWLNVDFWTSK